MVYGGVGKMARALGRKKAVGTKPEGAGTELARVLGTLDLTALGVGSTLGVGVYVLAGFVSRDEAGPAVVISFVIAAAASMLAGLCYAEFGARVPRAGSAYVYSYVTVGEFIAFIIGWNLILEYIIGAASVVRALSSYIDALAGNVIEEAFTGAMPMNVSFLSPYPDFFAFGLTVAFSLALAFGAKESSVMNNIFTLLNLSVVLYVIITGLFKADIDNWRVDPADVPPDAEGAEHVGAGGFFPFGASGVLKGAATCFYAFIGFDCVATTGEEARNPKRSIPIAIVLSLFIVFLAYFGVSAVLTLMWPYYLQDDKTPLPHVYEELNWPVAKWIVSVGAVFGLFSSLMGALYPLPRIIYAMASDGLLFAWLGRVHPRTHTPLVGTLVAGVFTGLMAMLFDLSQLANMMAIGTLLAYSIVAACVMMLRYGVDEENEDARRASSALQAALADCTSPSDPPPSKSVWALVCSVAGRMADRPHLARPTPLSATVVMWATALFCLCGFGAAAVGVYSLHSITGPRPLLALFLVCLCCMLLMVVCIAVQPTSSKQLAFKVPFVPILPAVSIVINICLMLMLDTQTWIRFGVWMVIGLAIYFLYGIWNSHERPSKKKTTLSTIYGGTDLRIPAELIPKAANP